MDARANTPDAMKRFDAMQLTPSESIPTSLSNSIMSQARIMMIDDEPLNMQVLQVHLEQEGYRHFMLIDQSTRALESIREHRPDVVLLDLVMPELSGFDILQLMREDAQLKQLPVVVLTSSDDAETKLRALRLGATDFLAKPVDASELALRMRNTLAARAYQQRLTYFDPLTQVPNRLFFTSVLQHTIDNVCGQQRHAHLILVNINRFKLINDSLGPDFGDAVLVHFCERLRQSFSLPHEAGRLAKLVGPPTSCLARLSGDGFAVLLLDQDAPASQGEMEDLLNAVHRKLEIPLPIGEQTVHLSVRMGVASLSCQSPSVDMMINHAETAMLHARRMKDAAYTFYSEHMNADAREMLSIENGMRTAIANGEIFLVYQAKVDVRSGAITGAEALARWMHPEYGLISPVSFIPLAENTGMIVSIGDWVLREACNQAAWWRGAGHSDFRIAVNVSIRQLQEFDFIESVDRALTDAGLPAEALTIEITETMVMEEADSNLISLQRLKSLGVSLSIDDFGTGYSSLSYLNRFPFDQIKIDRAFLRDVTSAEQTLPIVRAVVTMAHDLGLSVVAEGVETPLHLAHIKALGCEQYQGYLCNKPSSAEDFTRLLSGDERRCA